MATREPGHDAGSRRGESTIKAAALEISLYIAVYLAVWVILHVMSAPGPADAVAPDSSMAAPPAATGSIPSAGAYESPPD